MIFGLVWLIVAGIMAKVCSRDARRRGKSPLLVCIIVIFFFPLGAIVWLLFRPEPVDDTRERREFRLENHRLQ